MQNSPHSLLLHLLAIITFPKSLAAVRSAVASALLSSEHAGNLYSVVDIADALNIAADVERNAAITTKVDANLIRRAFAHPDDEFVLQYESYFGCRRNKNVLYARRPVRTARSEAGVFAIGRFSSMEVAKRANVIRWEVSMDDARAGLVQLLEEFSKHRGSKKKRAAADTSPEDSRGFPTQRLPLVSIQPPQSGNEPPATIYYMLGGRAGKMALPSNGLILLRKLRENLLPCDDEENEMRARKEFIVGGYGPTQCWVPVGTEVVAKHQLTRLRQQAKVASQWNSLFDGKQCKLSNRFLRTLSEFGLHTTRGSKRDTMRKIKC